MWMPHSISVYNNKIHFLESMTGKFYCGNYNLISTLNGYIRGMDFDGKYFFIGISDHRATDKLRSANNFIINSGVFILDPINNFSNLIKVNNTSAVHSLIIL